VDVVLADDSGVLLLLPETGTEGADQCIKRLISAVPTVRAGVIRRATFPDDGVTRGALLAILDGRTTGLPEPHDLPRLRVEPSTSMSTMR
jgi:hypothetical protein